MPLLESRPTTGYTQGPMPNVYGTTIYSNSGVPSTTSAGGGGGNWWSNMSPETRAALIQGGFGVAGGLMAGAGQAGQNRENREFSAEQAALDRAAQLYIAQMNQRQRQAELGLQNTQATPSRQDWRQRQALMADILPQLRNASVTPPGDLGRFTPQMSGGLRIPEGGFSPEALAFFSPEARVSAEADLDRAGQVASGGLQPVPNYAGGGYGSAGLAPGQQVTDYASQIRQQIAQQQAQAQQQGLSQAAARLGQSRTEQQRQPQGGGSSTGQRLMNAAIGAGLGYLGARYGGGNMNPWWGAAMGAGSGFIGR